MKTCHLLLLAAAAALGAAPAAAHVSLREQQAQAGADYTAVLRVGHGCDAAGTTALSVRLPAGFAAARPEAKPGWTVSTRDAVVTWTAAGKDAVLQSAQKGEFVLTGRLPRTPGPLWLKVLQTCEQGSLDWAQLPESGTSTAGLKTPAVLLEVLSARDLAQLRALPQVEGAWVRSSVPGQQGTGAFMRLTAKEPMQLVGASTPAAGSADVHEMKMEGDVMRMRPVARLDLPAGQPVELKPGGYHLMLQDLKQPLAKDTTVPLTLLLRNAQGQESRLELKLPVLAQAPGTTGAQAPAAGEHKH